VHSAAPVLAVRTKADLVSVRDQSHQCNGELWVSAERGMGLPDLITEIDRVISDRHGEITPDLPILSSARHRRVIQTAYAETKEFDQAWIERRLPATVAAVHVRTAVSALEELIGTVEIEDVLDRVFSSFCVGK
jgi:tRNA modification GTPase